MYYLGNNDGMNLSAPEQFHSKEISKSNVTDDMVASNRYLYNYIISYLWKLIYLKYICVK